MAREVVEGFLMGLHRSPHRGFSAEYAELRAYQAGDDLRYIDWRMYGRSDRYYVKQFEEDTNLRCLLLTDVSGSMRYGNGAMNKYEYASTVAVSLAYLALKQSDAVGCVSFDAAARITVPQRTRRNHLDSIIQALDVSNPMYKTDLYRILRTVAEGYPRRGLIVLTSDLLVERPGLFRGLKLLRSRGHDVMIFHILDDDELDFPFTGPTRFEGLEVPDVVRCNPRALREGYLNALGEYLDEVRRGCARHAVDYALIRTSQPLDAALAAYLSRRLATVRSN